MIKSNRQNNKGCQALIALTRLLLKLCTYNLHNKKLCVTLHNTYYLPSCN